MAYPEKVWKILGMTKSILRKTAFRRKRGNILSQRFVWSQFDSPGSLQIQPDKFPGHILTDFK